MQTTIWKITRLRTMSISITELKKYLYKEPDNIRKLLEYYNFYGIHVTTKEIRCARDKESNRTSIRILINENLNTEDFAKAIKGDIFSIICNSKQANLFDVVNVTKSILNIEGNLPLQQNKRQIFGGIFDTLKKHKDNGVTCKILDEQQLKTYDNGYNIRFLRDGISLKTQKKFRVGYCEETNRITVPWRDLDGNLVGVMGRYNGTSDVIPKWFPVIPFYKSLVLFGYSENYVEILNNDIIYIGESEKFVLQLDTMGYNNCVALGKNSISDTQMKAIFKTLPKKIVMCYDEGLDINIIINQCMKIKESAKILNISVGYVYDDNNEILKEGSKDSPSDLGKQNFERLVNNYVRWL